MSDTISIECRLDFLCAKLDNVQACLDEIKEAVICSCDAEGCFTMSGFDYESGTGFYGSGAFQATVNGVATSTPWNFNTDGPKSEVYAAMIDQINATPGWSVSIVDDPLRSTNDLVQWQFEYCGDAGDAAILTINRQGGDVIMLNANDGTGSFTDDNGPISDGRQPVACE